MQMLYGTLTVIGILLIDCLLVVGIMKFVAEWEKWCANHHKKDKHDTTKS